MSNESTKRSSNWFHEGYVDGLKGINPDERLSSYPDGEYSFGWLIGDTDRKAGVTIPKYFGYFADKDLPIKQGMEITIKKGTTVYSGGKSQVAQRTYKVKVHHILPGSHAYTMDYAHREESSIFRPNSPRIVWPGSGSYWTEVDINDVPEANS